MYFNIVFLEVMKYNIHKQDTACEIIVASAAPLTFILKPNINIGSNIILQIAPIKTVNILVFAFPCAVMNAFNPYANCTNIVPIEYILKYLKAYIIVFSLAPKNKRSGLANINRNIVIVTAIIIKAIAELPNISSALS